MKTKFSLDYNGATDRASAQIIGKSPHHKPYVVIDITRSGESFSLWVNDKDLQLFAVNILKSLKSKKLKP